MPSFWRSGDMMRLMRWLLLVSLSPLSRADDSWPVILPECGARLERRSAEADVLVIRTDCPVSLQSLAQLLDAGVERLFSDGSSAIRSLYLGRLMNYPEWSQTLAEAAAQSPEWDSRRGRPRKRGESDNLRVTMLLNGPAYPHDLKPVFSRYGVTACIAGVEKVLVFEAKELFPPASAMAQTVSPSARLPADAQVWLKLRPLTAECTNRDSNAD